MHGEVDKSALFTQFNSFAKGFNQYQISSTQSQLIRQWPEDLHIDVYFGSWCHDSEREVPKFLKLVENSKVSYRLIALDYQKTDPQGLAKKDKVKYTPTFVIKKSGIEIGRIVENTTESFAQDISQLLP